MEEAQEVIFGLDKISSQRRLDFAEKFSRSSACSFLWA
jgi:hypothetical protein